MGQQQILLIVLGAILVGIATVVGINMFTESAAQANLDAVSHDLLTLAARAQQYYRKPVAMGGGGKSFEALKADSASFALLSNHSKTDNGEYSIKQQGTKTQLVLVGEGYEDGDGVDGPLTVECIVTPTGATLDIKDR